MEDRKLSLQIVDSIIDIKQMSISQSWIEDLSLTYKILNQKSCRSLVTTFQQASIEYFDLKASFMQDYQLQQFQRQFKLQSESSDSKETYNPKGKTNYNFQRNPDYPKQFIMDLGKEQIKGHVFMDVFKEQLQKMKQQYQIRISTNGYKLYIFMREGQDLNIICKNKLLDMSHSLQIFYGRQTNLINMFEVSSILREKLTKQGVNVWFKKQYGKYFSIFFSTSLNISKMITSIQELTRFDISIFNLHHKSISQEQSQSVKYVIKQILKDFIKKLEEEYQIQLQFSQGNHFIVFHVKHAIFGDQPIFNFQQRLNNLVILSVKSQKIKQFDNKLRKLIKISTFIFQIMNKKRDQTYIAVDLFKIYNKKPNQINKQVQQFLKLFLILIEPQFQIKIYLNHITAQFAQVKDRIINISQQNNLVLVNEQFHECAQKKAIFKLKDLSENILHKRQKQLLLFVQGLLTPFNNKSNQSVNFIDQSELQNLSNSISNQNSNSLSKSSIVEQKYQIPWLKITYISPKRTDFGQQEIDFRKDRRSRTLQEVLNSQSANKFKVWSLQLSKNLKLPQEYISPYPCLLKSVFKGGKLKDTYELSTLSNFKIKQQGVIGYLTSQLSLPFIPLYIFQKIQ